MFVAAVALAQASHATYYAFGTIHWQRLGIGETVIGLLWAWGVVAEVALFAVASRLFKGWTPAAMMILGAGGAVVRWTATAADPGVAALFLLQTLHACSFGLVQLGAIRHVTETVAPGRSASALAVVTSVSGAVTGLAVAGMGPAYAALGGRAYLLAARAGGGGIRAYGVSEPARAACCSCQRPRES